MTFTNKQLAVAGFAVLIVVLALLYSFASAVAYAAEGRKIGWILPAAVLGAGFTLVTAALAVNRRRR